MTHGTDRSRSRSESHATHRDSLLGPIPRGGTNRQSSAHARHITRAVARARVFLRRFVGWWSSDTAMKKKGSIAGRLAEARDKAFEAGDALPEEIRLRQRRFHILQEMLTTERAYVRTLHELVECYYEPMQRCARGLDAAGSGRGSPPTLSSAEFDVLFHPSLVPIVRCQEALLRDLEEAWTTAQPETAKAPDFSQHFERILPQLLELYSEYIGNYRKAAALHSNLAVGAGGVARQQQLVAFMNDTEIAGAAPLASSLITPVQRLTRYEMLFKELLHHTSSVGIRARAELVLSGIARVNIEINGTGTNVLFSSLPTSFWDVPTATIC